MKRRIGCFAILTIALVFTTQPWAWSQKCQVITAGAGIGKCNEEGAMCGTEDNPGACVSGARPGSSFKCNCIGAGGVIVPPGQPGTSMALAITPPFVALGSVTVKELNTGAKSVKDVQSFLVFQDGTNQFSSVSAPLVPGNTTEQTFTLESSEPVPVVAGVFAATLDGVRVTAFFETPDGTTGNIVNGSWIRETKNPYYYNQELIDTSEFASTPVLGPFGAGSDITAVSFYVYNNTWGDQTYTSNLMDDSGNVNNSSVFTGPASGIGTTTLTPLVDFNVEMASGTGIASVELGDEDDFDSRGAGAKGSKVPQAPAK